ncbi:MAG TPA: hypothetical protein VKU62_09210 [Thermoanaerobaculia bacterium]|nr:hypothetical protein [Thermoanaerobaculia bacterium]
MAFGVALLIPAHSALAQQHTQFDEHDRQTASNWYEQHKTNPPKGLRSSDRLSAEEQARIKPGETLDRNLRRKTYTPPRDLVRHLPKAPAHYQYVMIGGHLVLVDTHNHQVRDVIQLRHDRT